MQFSVEDLYVKFGPMVLRRCRFLLKDEESALDAMQDVFVNILKRQDKIVDRGLSSLLYTMATNTCLNILRAKKNGVFQNFEDEMVFEIACYDDHEDRQNAQEVIDDFFAEDLKSYRNLAMMYFIDGLTLEEAAKETGLSVSGVRKRLAKVKARGKVLKEAVL